jgi:hypothetical protein
MTSSQSARDGGSRAVSIFITYLKEVPLETWIDAARRRRTIRGMAEAEAQLQIIVRHRDDQRDVFVAKAAVLDVLQRFECAEGRRLTRSRYATDHLRPATEHAALAVLLRQRLSPAQFATLYEPFESVIPVALLFGLSE